MCADSSESFHWKRSLEKHIGDHLLNFSLFAFLDDDDEMREKVESDAIRVANSRFLDSGEEDSRGNDDLNTVENTPVQEDVAVLELDYEVNWNFLEPPHELLVATPAVPPDFLFVPSTISYLSHVCVIEKGSRGEVHEVWNRLTLATLIV
jgi:hypothetical protein